MTPGIMDFLRDQHPFVLLSDAERDLVRADVQAQFLLHRGDNGIGDFILDDQHVVQVTVESLRPQMPVATRVDQLRRNTDPVAGPARFVPQMTTSPHSTGLAALTAQERSLQALAERLVGDAQPTQGPNGRARRPRRAGSGMKSQAGEPTRWTDHFPLVPSSSRSDKDRL